jgi:hypothetical protein
MQSFACLILYFLLFFSFFFFFFFFFCGSTRAPGLSAIKVKSKQLQIQPPLQAKGVTN